MRSLQSVNTGQSHICQFLFNHLNIRFGDGQVPKYKPLNFPTFLIFLFLHHECRHKLFFTSHIEYTFGFAFIFLYAQLEDILGSGNYPLLLLNTI